MKRNNKNSSGETGQKPKRDLRSAAEKKKKLASRDAGIDLTKAFAILCVLFIHSFTYCLRAPAKSADWYGAMFMSSAARCAVPLFLMATGALMLNPQKKLTVRQIYLKYLPRLLIALFFWAYVYKVYVLWETGYTTGVKALTAANLWFDFKSLFFFKHESHLYYVHIVLLFYAMLPVLRSFVKSADRKTLRYALAVWFVAGIVLPTARPYYPYDHFSGIPVQWMLNMTWASMGYGLLGYAIHSSDWLKGKGWLCVLLVVIGLGGCYFGTVKGTIAKGVRIDDTFLGGFHIGNCLYAAGLMGLFRSVKLKKLSRPVAFLSKASFSVYLTHMLGIKRLTLEHFRDTLSIDVLMIPLLVLTLLAACLVLYFILSKIPVVKKYLV